MNAGPAPLPTVDAVAQLGFAVQRMLENRAAASDLSVVQTRMLGVLRDREPTMGELGAFLDLDKSSVSGLVERAERRGLVSRFRAEHDGRSVRVRLEDDGRRLIDTAAAEFAGDLEGMLGALTPAERTEWTRLTARLLAADAAARGIRL